MHDDARLIKAAAEGDREAWKAFIHAYGRLMYHYIHHTLSAHGHQCAQDEIQDIFQGLFAFLLDDSCRRLKTFTGKSGCKVSTWLRTITINYTVDHLRKARSYVSLDAKDDEGLTLLERLAEKANTCQDNALDQETLENLADCIEQLPAQDKGIVEMFFVRRCPPAAIAQALAISRAAFDMRKQRIIEKLKECFRKKGLKT